MQKLKVKTLKEILSKTPREICLLIFAFCLLTSSGFAKPKLASGPLEGTELFDLAAPSPLNAVVLHRNVSLNWDWKPPEPGPSFDTFGYEILRDTAVLT